MIRTSLLVTVLSFCVSLAGGATVSSLAFAQDQGNYKAAAKEKCKKLSGDAHKKCMEKEKKKYQKMKEKEGQPKKKQGDERDGGGAGGG